MLTLIIPAFSYGPPLERTWETFKPLCDELVIISTAFWEEDREKMRALTDKVIQLDWNATMVQGFGWMMNQGTAHAKNDGMMLFGVGETLEYSNVCDLPSVLEQHWRTNPKIIFRVDHRDDPNRWTRLWNRRGKTQWSGIIHEAISGGPHGDVVLRMLDTPKPPRDDIYEQETLRYLKTCLYNWQYRRLLDDNSLLGATDPGWLRDLRATEVHLNTVLSELEPLVTHLRTGDLPAFLDEVKRRVDAGKAATGVNYDPTGQPMSEGALPAPA